MNVVVMYPVPLPRYRTWHIHPYLSRPASKKVNKLRALRTYLQRLVSFVCHDSFLLFLFSSTYVLLLQVLLRPVRE
jgi:hypothetical protein